MPNIMYKDGVQQIENYRRNQKTIQTHNNKTIVKSTWDYTASWIDCDGFDRVALTTTNNGGANAVNLQWSNDGSNIHFDEGLLTPTTANSRGVETAVKARYVKVAILNNDTGADHIYSAWVLLKN
jgi:hypothetical protein